MLDQVVESAAVLASWKWIVLCTIGVIIILRFLRGSVVYIANTEYGIVERKWAVRGKSTSLIALDGSAGFLPEVLRGGWHFLVPFQYRVHKRDLIRVDQIAYLVARIGAPLREGQALAEWPLKKGAEGIEPLSREWETPVDPEDARGFLTCGGQRGVQRHIVRTGTYAFHTALFAVITAEHVFDVQGSGSQDDLDLQLMLEERDGFNPIVIGENDIGIVTVQDGPALAHGEIIAPTVGADASNPATFHNSFQDVPRFLAAGGRRGRQEAVLVEGTYYINRFFATIERCEKLKIGIGTVGVINSYVGSEVTEALTGDQGRGRTVERGQRGIWSMPLEPGMYALNPHALEVTHVPTTNFSLRWEEDVTSRLSDARAESNRVSYDDDLREILIITQDGFECLLPLAMVAHISPTSAPHMIQRFSQVTRFVTQMLDPMVSSFFRDAAQERTLLEFVQQRTAIGTEALAHVRERLAQHRIDVEEVIVGTPRDLPGRDVIERLFDQLRSRQTAVQERLTYDEQGKAAEVQRALNEKRALASQQERLTASAVAIEVQTNDGKAITERRKQEAEGIRVTASAEADATKARAGAEAFMITARADADAHANEVMAKSVGGVDVLYRRFVVDRLAEAAQHLPDLPSTLAVVGGVDGMTEAVRQVIASVARP